MLMQPVKEFATVTDEAFTLVVLENGWQEWIKIDLIVSLD